MNNTLIKIITLIIANKIYKTKKIFYRIDKKKCTKIVNYSNMLINFIQELNIFTLYYIFYIPITLIYTILIIPYYFLSISKFVIVIITFFIPYVTKFIEGIEKVDSKIQDSGFQNTISNFNSFIKNKTQITKETFNNPRDKAKEMSSELLNRAKKYFKDFKNYCGKQSKKTKKDNKEVITTLIILVSCCVGILLLINIMYYILYPDIYKRAIKFNNYYVEFVRIFMCISMYILFNFTFSTGSMVPYFKEIITSQVIKRFNKNSESL